MANSDTRELDDYDRPFVEVRTNLVKVGQQDGKQIIGAAIQHVPEKDYRRFCCLSKREKCAEIRVLRYEDTGFASE